MVIGGIFMNKLHLDFETRSRCDLKKRGLDNYARDPSTKVLMLSWAVDDEPVQLWEPHKSKAPKELVDMVKRDKSTTLYAWNSAFERQIFKHVLKVDTDISRWRDPMVMALYAGMTDKLDTVCKIMRLPPELAKQAGWALIKWFCVPRAKITKDKTYEFNDWNTDPEKWEEFCNYCRNDTAAEREIEKRLNPFNLPPWEWELWFLDQKINEAGLPVDPLFIQQAERISERHLKEVREQLQDLTGLANPNSGPQFRAWATEHGYPFGDLRKGTVKRALEEHKEDMPAELIEALELREILTMTSLRKLDAIKNVNNPAHNRLRHAHQFMGASRTGRWAGRKVQTQNLKRPLKSQEDHLASITDMIRAGDYDNLEFEWGPPRKTVAGCVRSSFRAPAGKKLCVADLSAIEDVGLGYLARCETILDDHRNNRDPYLSFAVYMYGRPYESFTKKSPERTWAKPGRLGCGYRLGPGERVVNKNGDIEKTGLWGYAQSMGVDLTHDQCKLAVSAYREAYSEVVQFWYDLEEAAIAAVRTRQPQRVGYLTFDVKAPFLRMRLPSGRFLHYLRPKVYNKRFEKTEVDPKTGRKRVVDYWFKDVLSYEGLVQATRKWGRIDTHGGKLAENATQAFCRDILAMGMLRADKIGFEIVGHVHDEIITLIDEDSTIGLDHLIRCMTKPIKWAPGLPLKAAGYVDDFYKKD